MCFSSHPIHPLALAGFFVYIEIKMQSVIRCLKRLLPLVVSLSLLGGVAACGGGTDALNPLTQTATLIGDQEVPAVASAATGSATLTLERSTGVLTGTMTLNGITGATAAHIHDGAVGSNGGVVVTLSETTPGNWTVPAYTKLSVDQAAKFEAGTLYLNVHSAANTGGEIRGQIGREIYYAALVAGQEVPATASSATGVGVLVLDPLTKALSASISLTGMTATAAHIHSGTVGANGAVAIGLTLSPTDSSKWLVPAATVLSDAQVTSLKAGTLYFNAHSTAFASGEIRGQIGRKIGLATMTGAQEVPPTASVASGTGFLSIDPASRAVTGSVTLSGMTPTAAHIHLGATGANGALQVGLTQVGTTDVWSVAANTVMTADQYKAFLDGTLYFNAHSAAFASGEIRGQIR